MLLIARNSFIQISKLTNLKGRISYISSHARQENLYAVFETVDRKFWRELANCNQEEFLKSGSEGKCIEARELIIALPESFVEYSPNRLLEVFTDHFKQNYGTECIAASHHNKRKTNYHIHLIFSERKLLEEPMEKIASRNMFYDENGKHVRTKKEILDEDGQIRSGCKIILKGEVYERKIFTIKDSRFKSENFLDGVKKSYTDLINIYVRSDKDKLKTFERNGAYLPMKKIGKNNPKAEQIEVDNMQRQKWNQTVDRALVSGVQEQKIIEVRKMEIGKKVSQSIHQSGNRPEMFAKIIQMAIRVLELIITKIIRASKTVTENAMELTGKDVLPALETRADETIALVKAPEKQVPTKPKKSTRAAAYMNLSKNNGKLQQKNKAIYQKEQKLDDLKKELQECRGFWKGKRRKELQGEISQTEKQLENMKKDLSKIVTSNGFQNVRAFQLEYTKAETEYGWYKKALKDWKQMYGTEREKEPKSIHARLEQHKQKIKEQGRNDVRVRKVDRDAR